jgi:hypothetical protein
LKNAKGATLKEFNLDGVTYCWDLSPENENLFYWNDDGDYIESYLYENKDEFTELLSQYVGKDLIMKRSQVERFLNCDFDLDDCIQQFCS